MKNNMKGHPLFWDLWLWKCGLPEEADKVIKEIPSMESLRKTEWAPNFEEHMRAAVRYHPSLRWSKRFEELMRDGLIMGAFRYGLLNARGKPQFERTGSAVKRLKVYLEGGDQWQLVDIANMCLLEFEEGYDGCKDRIAHSGELLQAVKISAVQVYKDTFNGGTHHRVEQTLEQYRSVGDPALLAVIAVAMMSGFVSDRHPKKHLSMGDAVIHTSKA